MLQPVNTVPQVAVTLKHKTVFVAAGCGWHTHLTQDLVGRGKFQASLGYRASSKAVKATQETLCWKTKANKNLLLLYNCNFVTVMSCNINVMCRLSGMGPLWKGFLVPKEVITHRLWTTSIEETNVLVNSCKFNMFTCEGYSFRK